MMVLNFAHPALNDLGKCKTSLVFPVKSNLSVSQMHCCLFNGVYPMVVFFML